MRLHCRVQQPWLWLLLGDKMEKQNWKQGEQRLLSYEWWLFLGDDQGDSKTRVNPRYIFKVGIGACWKLHKAGRSERACKVRWTVVLFTEMEHKKEVPSALTFIQNIVMLPDVHQSGFFLFFCFLNPTLHNPLFLCCPVGDLILFYRLEENPIHES